MIRHSEQTPADIRATLSRIETAIRAITDANISRRLADLERRLAAIEKKIGIKEKS